MQILKTFRKIEVNLFVTYALRVFHNNLIGYGHTFLGLQICPCLMCSFSISRQIPIAIFHRHQSHVLVATLFNAVGQYNFFTFKHYRWNLLTMERCTICKWLWLLSQCIHFETGKLCSQLQNKPWIFSGILPHKAEIRTM